MLCKVRVDLGWATPGLSRIKDLRNIADQSVGRGSQKLALLEWRVTCKYSMQHGERSSILTVEMQVTWWS